MLQVEVDVERADSSPSEPHCLSDSRLLVMGPLGEENQYLVGS